MSLPSEVQSSLENRHEQEVEERYERAMKTLKEVGSRMFESRQLSHIVTKHLGGK